MAFAGWIVALVVVFWAVPSTIVYKAKLVKGQSRPVCCTCWQMNSNWGWGYTWRGLFGVAVTGLQFPLVCVRAEYAVGRVRLGCSICWFEY